MQFFYDDSFEEYKINMVVARILYSFSGFIAITKEPLEAKFEMNSIIKVSASVVWNIM